MVALANPWGRGLSATLGFVASSRTRPAVGVAHTALCPRGASGGPLVAPDGGLLGFNVTRLDGGFVLATATDADTRERIEKLVAGERRSDRTLGVAIAPPRVAKRLRRSVGLDERDGLLVRGVEADSAAFGAGIRHGDLIVAVGDSPIASVDDLLAQLETGGDELAVTVLRGVDEHSAHGPPGAVTQLAERSALDAYSRLVVEVAERVSPRWRAFASRRSGAAGGCASAAAAPSSSARTACW